MVWRHLVSYYDRYDGKNLVDYGLARKTAPVPKIYKTSFVVKELTEDMLAEGADHIFVFSKPDDVFSTDERVTYCVDVDIEAMSPYYLQDLSESIVIIHDGERKVI